MLSRTPPTCAFCEAPACSEFVCERCGNDVCLAHVPLPGHRCLPCERLYFDRRDRIRRAAWFIVALVPVWLVFFVLAPHVLEMDASGTMRGFSTQIPILDLFLMAVIASYFFGKLAVALRVRVLRRAFLAERPGIGPGWGNAGRGPDYRAATRGIEGV